MGDSEEDITSYEYDTLYTGVTFHMTNHRTGMRSTFVEGANGVFSKNMDYMGDIFTRKFSNQGDVVYTMMNTVYKLHVVCMTKE